MESLAFWNNKGGTGKTSLAFQCICDFANERSAARVLVVDVCPQANLSELFLGGLEGDGGKNLLTVQGGQIRASIGGYFQLRLPRPYEPGTFEPRDFIVRPSVFNAMIPSNIDLVPGDPLLELQSNAMSTLANNTIPGTNTWARIISWIRDFLERTNEAYDYVFIDCNPSFSIYTQIALASADKVVIPVMADDSSRRAIQNAFSLIYGLKLPSEIYAQHMFATKMLEADLPLPTVQLVVKNRLTQYMGPASGYRAVLKTIDDLLEQLIAQKPDVVNFSGAKAGVEEVRDFQTTGVVAFARGTPFFRLKAGKLAVQDRRVAVDAAQIDDRVKDIKRVAARLF